MERRVFGIGLFLKEMTWRVVSEALDDEADSSSSSSSSLHSWIRTGGDGGALRERITDGRLRGINGRGAFALFEYIENRHRLMICSGKTLTSTINDDVVSYYVHTLSSYGNFNNIINTCCSQCSSSSLTVICCPFIKDSSSFSHKRSRSLSRWSC